LFEAVKLYFINGDLNMFFERLLFNQLLDIPFSIQIKVRVIELYKICSVSEQRF